MTDPWLKRIKAWLHISGASDGKRKKRPKTACPLCTKVVTVTASGRHMRHKCSIQMDADSQVSLGLEVKNADTTLSH